MTDDSEASEDDWDSEDVLDDSEYGQKKNEEENEEIYLVPTINYETYKDESTAKKRVNNFSSVLHNNIKLVLLVKWLK